MIARIDDAVILAEEFFTSVFGQLAEFLVRERDPPARIGNGDNRVRIDGSFQILKIFQRGFGT